MNKTIQTMIDGLRSTDYSHPETKHWTAYNYLKVHGVGHGNEIPRETMREVLGIKGNGTQYVMQYIARCPVFDLYICSDNGGYWIPEDEEDTNFDFRISRALSELETCIRSGAMTKADAHAFIQSIPEDTRVSGQSKIRFNSETPFVKRYGKDLEDNYEEWTFDRVYEYYKEVGGYPMKGLTKEEYIKEIRRIRSESEKNVF